jgi:signal transduction histidine kinase
MVDMDVMQRLVSTGSDAGYPALGWIAGYFEEPLCLRYRSANGALSERGCDRSNADAPSWVAAIFDLLGHAPVTAHREISTWSRTTGTLEIEPDRTRLIEHEGLDVKNLSKLTAVTLLTLDALIFWIVGRALKPATTIAAAVEKLGVPGDYEPLASFRTEEFAAIATGINRLAERLQHLDVARLRLSARLIETQEAERREIADELHQEFGQCVAAVGALSASLRQSVMNQQDVCEEDIEALESTADTMLSSLRSVLKRTSLPPVDTQGLSSSINDMVAAWKIRFPGSPVVALRIGIDRHSCLPKEVSLCVFRVIQEGLGNIARHAPGRRRVSVLIDADSRDLCVSVSNDRMKSSTPAPSTGLGLGLLAERVRCLNGRFEVEATEDAFTIRATLPVSLA